MGSCNHINTIVLLHHQDFSDEAGEKKKRKRQILKDVVCFFLTTPGSSIPEYSSCAATCLPSLKESN